MYCDARNLIVGGLISGVFNILDVEGIYMKFDGVGCLVEGGEVYKGVDGNGHCWVRCDERLDVDYYQAIVTGSGIRIYGDGDGGVKDGRYVVCGRLGRNVYGFRLPIVLPWDLFEVEYTGIWSVDGLRDFLSKSEEYYGLFFKCSGDEWWYIDRCDVGLEWPTERCKKMFSDRGIEDVSI